jgi:UDP-N-acetylmuramoylalanine--D-glutamate ligase
MNDRTSGKFDRDEHVLVIGLGRSGRASAEVLRERVGSLIITDEKPETELREAIADLAALGVRFVVPDKLGLALASITAAVLSPGIPLNGELVRRIQSAGIPVFSEVEVAYRICKAPIVAVTGTKGKTTTTTLIGEIFKRAGKTTFVGGNIGNALIHETAVATANDWIIAEVSSFQLETIRSFKPKISALTNISPDHLDRYHSMDEYAEAKYRIFANQGPGDTFVGNFDDARIAALLGGGEDGGSRIHTQARWFAREPHRETALYLRNERTIVYAPPAGDPRPIEIMDVAEIPLLGNHNIENVMTAILVALSAGLEREAIASAVRDFHALSHRLETVADAAGVLYVDDSKATNPGSVIAALRSFDRPIVLIAGGKAKGTDFAELGRVASSRAKAAVLIGEAGPEIAKSIKRAAVSFADSMADAVDQAKKIAEFGDVVLLSPGCASFDMFRSAEDRGEQFAAAVRDRVGVRAP